MTTHYVDYVNGQDGTGGHNGSSWALAWQTITYASTNSAAGDQINIAQSPVPYSIGNATWTQYSKTVTLAGAQTMNIDLCESVWTASATGVACANNSAQYKQGSYSEKTTLAASPATGTCQSYHATGTISGLGSYQTVSFWLYNSAAIVANNLILCLCSDTAGAVVVDSIAIPAIPSTSQMVCLNIARTGGGNLGGGSTIKSIALYTGSVAPAGSLAVSIDNVVACTTGGLNLTSLISPYPTPNAQGGAYPWLAIQSINGTTILLDNVNSTFGTAGRGYSGTSASSTATYARETIKTAMVTGNTTAVFTISVSGTAGNNISFQGGWDTGANQQTGETFFDGQNGLGAAISISAVNYLTTNLMSFCRYYTAMYVKSNFSTFTINNANNNNNSIDLIGTLAGNTFNLTNVCNNVNTAIYSNSGASINNSFLSNLNLSGNLGNAIYVGSSPGSCGNLFGNVVAVNNSQYPVYFASTTPLKTIFASLTTAHNGQTPVLYQVGDTVILNANFAEGYTGTGFISGYDLANYLGNVGGVANNSLIYTDGGNISSSSGTWTMTLSDATRISTYPLHLSVAKIAVNANSAVTVSIYMQKSHATNIAAQLICKGGQIAGVGSPGSNISTLCPSDTNNDQVTITLNPTAAGVVEILAQVWYVAGTGNVVLTNMSVSQA